MTKGLFSKQQGQDLDTVGLAVFEKTPDGFLVIGQEIVDCNGAAVRLLRWKSKAEILSRQPSEFSLPVLPSGER